MARTDTPYLDFVHPPYLDLVDVDESGRGHVVKGLHGPACAGLLRCPSVGDFISDDIAGARVCLSGVKVALADSVQSKRSGCGPVAGNLFFFERRNGSLWA